MKCERGCLTKAIQAGSIEAGLGTALSTTCKCSCISQPRLWIIQTLRYSHRSLVGQQGSYKWNLEEVIWWTPEEGGEREYMWENDRTQSTRTLNSMFTRLGSRLPLPCMEEKYSWFGKKPHKANELKGELAAGWITWEQGFKWPRKGILTWQHTDFITASLYTHKTKWKSL